MLVSTPESITTSLHWSKELQKAGWQFPCVLGWKVKGDEDAFVTLWHSDLFPAPTASEIFSLLPDSQKITIHVGKAFDEEDLAEVSKLMKEIGIGEYHGCGRYILQGWNHVTIDNSLANAAAHFYCRLAQNGLLPSPNAK